ncbi:MAG TPA: hypothetical protein P5127_06020, partial [Oscillospiraceae bacterium]|nr:hypothetical protein [Oscillospiraceae bacterium]
MKKILITILSLMLCVGLLSPTVLALQDSVLIQGETYRVEDYYYKDPPKRTASSQADLGGAITALLSAMDRVDPDCDISGYQVHKDQMGYVFSVLSSDPDFFYITSFNYSHYSVSGIVFKVTFFYIGVKEDILPMKVLYNQAVDKTLQIFDPAMTAPEKTLIAHDYLALHTKYDEENAIQGTIPHISHTAYGALVLGVAVCDGYSRAYIALLSRAGLDVIKISSESMNHAWNMVKLGSYWYHVDVTWDDPVFDPEYNWYNNDYDLEGSVRHEYFLLSDSKISSDHSGWSSPYPANSSLYDGKYIDIKSGMFWQGGFWYYNESGKIKRSDFNLNNTTIIKADVNGSGNRYSYIGLYNNRI